MIDGETGGPAQIGTKLCGFKFFINFYRLVIIMYTLTFSFFSQNYLGSP